MELDRQDWPYGAITWGINVRSRLARAFTGDMGIFIRRSVFESIGGYPTWPLMEDLALSERMHRCGTVAYLRERMVTSSRRWEQGGPWRTVALMQVLRAGISSGCVARETGSLVPNRSLREFKSFRSEWDALPKGYEAIGGLENKRHWVLSWFDLRLRRTQVMSPLSISDWLFHS